MYQGCLFIDYLDTFLVWYNTVYSIHRFDIDYPPLYQSIRVKYYIFIGWFTNTLRNNVKDIESLFTLDCLEAQDSVGKVKEQTPKEIFVAQ